MAYRNRDTDWAKEVRHSDFLVDRPLARDVYIPYEACRSLTGNRVVVNVKANEVNHQGWANPEITEAPLTR